MVVFYWQLYLLLIISHDYDMLSFSELNEVITSYVVRDGKGAYTCSVCGHQNDHLGNIKRHIEARHVVTKGFECPMCNKFFKTRHSLSRHKKVFHNME